MGSDSQRNRRGYPFLVCCITALAPSSGRGTEPVDPFLLSPEQLFAAAVTSVSKSEGRLFDAPAAISVLTSEDIHRSGATSIADALRLIPGVQVARGTTGAWAVSVRGFNSGLANKLLVLLDGREVYDQLFSGVYWDVQDTMLEDIERIEVIRGPGASLWGANAVNGVINIITKKASDTQGNLVSALAGNHERGTLSVRHGSALDQGHWRAYAKLLDRDHQETVAGNNAQDDWRAGRAGFRADWQNQKTDRFTLQGDAYRSDTGQWRLVDIFASPFTRLEEEDIRADGINLLGRWTRDLNSGAQLTVQSYVDYTSRDQRLIEDERLSFDLDTQLDLPQSGRHQWIIGGRYRLSHDELTPSELLYIENPDRNDQLFSAFVQDKITLQPKQWFLTLGTKIEHNDYSGLEIQPNARLQWHPNEQQMMWASVARAVRTPSRLEHDLNIIQAIGAGPASLDTIINRDFESEQLIAYELGYRHQLTSALLLDVATFYNDYADLSTFTFQGLRLGVNPARLVIPYAPTNDTTAETYGFEAMASWRADPAVNLTAGYSLLQMMLHGHGSATLAPEAAETRSPQQQLFLRAQWDINERLALDNTVHYVDFLPGFDIKHYWRLDTRLGWKLDDSVQLELVGQDWLGPMNREFTGTEEASASRIGPSIYGRVTWHF